MTPGDLLVVLGLNGRVAALLRKDGRLLWATDLPGVIGDRFVTVTLPLMLPGIVSAWTWSPGACFGATT